MVHYNKQLIGSLFNKSKTTSTTADDIPNTNTTTIITGIALTDSANGEVLVQIGDPIEELLYEEEEEGFEVYLEDDEDDIGSVNEDDESEVLGEDDDEIDDDELDSEDGEGDIYIGDDADNDVTDEVAPDDEDDEGNIIEEVTE